MSDDLNDDDIAAGSILYFRNGDPVITNAPDFRESIEISNYGLTDNEERMFTDTIEIPRTIDDTVMDPIHDGIIDGTSLLTTGAITANLLRDNILSYPSYRFINVQKELVDTENLCEKTISYMNILLGNFINSITHMDKNISIGMGKHLGNEKLIEMYQQSMSKVFDTVKFYSDDGTFDVYFSSEISEGTVDPESIDDIPESKSLLHVVGSEYEDIENE